jgi:hypothetical protein
MMGLMIKSGPMESNVFGHDYTCREGIGDGEGAF